MAFEIYYPTSENGNYGLVMTKYNDRFSISQAEKSKKDGRIYKRFGFKKEYVEGEWVASDGQTPLAIGLGNQHEAIKALQYFLEQLNAPVEESDYER